MFNDRDLGVLGAGALLSVLCLLLPFSFAVKVALGFGVLVSFMVLAFLRLGPDRIPPEEWLRRRVRYRLQARRYTYQQRRAVQPRRKPRRIQWPWSRLPKEEQAMDPQPVRAGEQSLAVPLGGFRPVALVLDEARAYPLATLLLGVLGVYLLVWLAGGGAEELAWLIGEVWR